MKASAYSNLLCYHAMPLSSVSFGKIIPDPSFSDEDFRVSFRWAQKQIGFYPLFLAVGTQEAERLTGYSNQWMVNIGTRFENGRSVNIRRRKGEYPNDVLMIFKQDAIPEPVFTDFMWWNIVLNETMNGGEPDRRTVRNLFKKSWSSSDWLRLAARDSTALQMMVPCLDLSRACQVWVRNQATRKKLEALGFTDVLVKRTPILSAR